nr:putative reverse transcriptase domain-containing protein [Tanacetum cinerariifolium]
MDVPLLLDHTFDLFAVEPVSGLAEAPDNQNRWIEWDVPLGCKMDEPIENPGFDEEEELNEFMDDNQDEEVKEWLMAPVTPPRATTPESPIGIRSFLGLAGYYRRFIENFSKIAKSLTLLDQKNKTYVWGDKQDEAFRILKEKLCNAHVLALPDGPNNYVVYCDASKQ